ncbi:MAG TPA: carboxylating nicotinate-nucleotide diphosphorylase [Gammaproteobacteria bacterium]|jgi:nicotinate-nucleotide pyrophosphorylase (carboxylating)|nr:carboxylating nicotinate-nucleotide diphosphorylase [Gammaproteobacteria bacterium]
MMKNTWQLNHLDAQLIELALLEDLGWPYADVTTATLFAENTTLSQAKIVSKHPTPITLAGLPVVNAILAKMGDQCTMQTEYTDGQRLLPGATLLTLHGPANTLLMVERTVLNFLQHLCAIATLTAQFVDRIKHTTTKILDTRKTMPGFRHLAKYAVHCGGGVNHRMGLYDALMLKDTHIDLLGGMAIALQILPEHTKQTLPVIVEVRTPEELVIVLNLNQELPKVTRVLLDNMSPATLQKCVSLCQGKMSTEASGNINFATVASVAECGVDFISIGQLTHSAGNVDLSMQCHR